MYSSTGEKKLEAVYFVQSGVSLWDQCDISADWHSKTITVCSLRPALMVGVLRNALEREAERGKALLRCHIAMVPASQNALQRRAFDSAIKAQTPGFAFPEVRVVDGLAIVVARSTSISQVELGYLSTYRHTLLVATGDLVGEFEGMFGLLEGLSLPFGFATLVRLRADDPSRTVVRVFEEDSQVVFQATCDIATASAMGERLDSLGVARVEDRTAALVALGCIR